MNNYCVARVKYRMELILTRHIADVLTFLTACRAILNILLFTHNKVFEIGLSGPDISTTLC